MLRGPGQTQIGPVVIDSPSNQTRQIYKLAFQQMEGTRGGTAYLPIATRRLAGSVPRRRRGAEIAAWGKSPAEPKRSQRCVEDPRCFKETGKLKE